MYLPQSLKYIVKSPEVWLESCLTHRLWNGQILYNETDIILLPGHKLPDNQIHTLWKYEKKISFPRNSTGIKEPFISFWAKSHSLSFLFFSPKLKYNPASWKWSFFKLIYIWLVASYFIWKKNLKNIPVRLWENMKKYIPDYTKYSWYCIHLAIITLHAFNDNKDWANQRYLFFHEL